MRAFANQPRQDVESGRVALIPAFARKMWRGKLVFVKVHYYISQQIKRELGGVDDRKSNNWYLIDIF